MAKKDKDNKKATFWSSFGSFAVAVLAILSVRWLLVEPYVIPSGSMIPTLLIHDHILVNKLAYGIRFPFTSKWITEFSSPKRGDIIVFRSVEDDGYFMIKRVIGVEGDTIEMTDQGQLKVNGELVPRELIADAKNNQEGFYRVDEEDIGGDFANFEVYKENYAGKTYRTMLMPIGFRATDRKFSVPPGHLFMMGDNRDNSKDSRSWGALPKENVLGKAMFVWLSCQDTLPFAPFLCNPLELRWRRFFNGIN